MGNFYGIPSEETLGKRSIDLSQHFTFEEYMKHIGSQSGASKAITDIPINLFPMPNVIERLNASFNRLATIPEPLSFHLPHLSHLDLSHNQIATLPDSFRFLLHLKTLNLSSNVLQRFPVVAICSLPQLEHLDVSSNRLLVYPDEMGHVTTLRRLNLSQNLLTRFSLSRRQATVTMEVVLAYYNRCHDNPPQSVCDEGSDATLSFFRKKYQEAKEKEEKEEKEEEEGENVVEFPRLRGSISEAIMQAKFSPSGQPTQRQLGRATLRGATSALNPTEVADKVCGLIYGAALGDAFGLCTEFMTEDQCRFHYGGGRLSIENMVRDRHRLKWTPGDWTDDTDQLILLLDSLILWGGVVDEMDFAERLLQWATRGFSELGDTVGFGIGNTVGKCLNDKNFVKNPHDVAERVWTSCGHLNAANGAVMRTAILGVPNFDDVDEVTQNATRICKATHADPRCQASCVAVSVMIATMLKGDADASTAEGVEGVLDAARRTARPLLTEDDHVKDFEYYTNCKDFLSVKCCESRKIGYTFKPLGAAFVALRKRIDYKTAISDLIMLGGDADTNAAVVGAVLGCKCGYSRLPADWLASLLPKQKSWLNAKINCLLDLMGLP